MVVLETSVRASGNGKFQRAQSIARYPHRKLLRKPKLVSEFFTLVSENLTFFDDWTSKNIKLPTYSLYRNKVPTKEAENKFIQQVSRYIRANDWRENS